MRSSPALVEGQLVGGAAQGIAGALMEEFRYTDDGQPVATTLADYLVPTAGEAPPIGVHLGGLAGGEQPPRGPRQWTTRSVAPVGSGRYRSSCPSPATRSGSGAM